MELIHTIFLTIHISAGIASLGLGLIPLITKKGGSPHKKTGIYFYYAMFIVAITALITSLYDGFTFLTYLGVFAVHMNYFGIRAVRNKEMNPKAMDWIVNIAGLINAVMMIATLKIVLLVFGLVSLSNVFTMFRVYYLKLRGKEIKRLEWLTQHIGLMIGVYISTITAFLVNNVRTFYPAWVIWFLPTVVLIPFSIYWTRKYVGKPRKQRLA
ncbi:MAG: hypothetical protein ACE364_06660 [Chlorobiota bacterium]